MIFVVICVSCIAIFIHHSWFRRRKSTPKLFYGDSKFHEYIINKVPRLKEPYTPPLGLGNRHVHTIICCLEFSPLNYKRENVHLPDGGLASLDWLDNEACLTDTSPVLVVIPGVGGGKEGINKVCKMAAGRFRVVVFNRRGHCGSLLTTPRLQCFGETSDFRYCVEHIHRKFPKAAMAGVAYSAGTAILSRYMGEYAGRSYIGPSVFIGSGFDLSEIEGMSTIYEKFILHMLKTSLVKPNELILKPVVDIQAVYNSKSIEEFEGHLYFKMHGFKDVDDMWLHNDPMANVDSVVSPVLCINSLDDPICVAGNIPYDHFQRPNWMLVTTEKGGHCGFIENYKLESWAGKLAVDYIDAVLEYQDAREEDITLKC
ncbi:phospholipase ABHD3-like [Haliotis rufescens]|uniref:phospholipase ABHD3-like n=1 Tax=Haliotis rufescens TaxID=6454 RepID=UPI00201E8E20|nr:phospholipase ABHD3-like [Haliotis rufescens]